MGISYKIGRVLLNVLFNYLIFSQNGSFITKWVVYYKMGSFLQNESFITK